MDFADGTKKTTKTRAELIAEACQMRGFTDAREAEDLKTLQRVTTVRASHANGAGLLTHSIGAPAQISAIADAGRMTVTNNDPFQQFFGEARYPYKSDFDIADQTTWTLPQAYQGMPLPLIQETIEQFVFLAENWYQQVVAPIEVTTAMGIAWSRWEFLPHMTNVTPELGVNRLVRSYREKNSARFTRRGIAFMLEHGFMLTAEGRRHYLMNVNQLIQAAVETNKFDLIHSLLTAHDMNKHWLIENDKYSGKSIQHVYKHGELKFWDIVKKQKNGFEIMDTDITESMNKWRGVANTWIIHPDVANFLTQIPTEKTDFFIAGAQGPVTLREGPDAFTSFRGNRIYRTRAYHVTGAEPIDVMRFQHSIGEYHLSKNQNLDYEGGDDYRSKLRDIQIYDEDRDDYMTVTLGDMLDNCERFDKITGEVLDKGPVGQPRAYSTKEWDDELLHYRTVDGRNAPVDYFINVSARHFSADRRRNVGRTVKSQMKSLPGDARAEELLESVRMAIQQMEDYTWEEAAPFLNRLGAVMGAAAESDRPDRGGRYPLFNLLESTVTDRKNGFCITPNALLGVDPGTAGLPPGFQSWEGLKTIAAAYKLKKSRPAPAPAAAAAGGAGGVVAAAPAPPPPDVFKNVNPKLLDDIEEFVDYYENVTRRLKRLFPDSEMLKPENASSWWQAPSIGTVLFNNFIHKYRVPLWFKNGGVAVGLNTTVKAGLDNEVGNRVKSAIKIIDVAEVGGIVAPNTRAYLGAVIPPPGDNETASTVSYRVAAIATIVNAISGARGANVDANALAGRLKIVEDQIVSKSFPNVSALFTVDNQGDTVLLEAVHELSKQKKSKKDEQQDPLFSVDSGALRKSIAEVGKIIAALFGQVTTQKGLGDASTVLIRTTLLAAPKLLSGLAQAVERGVAAAPNVVAVAGPSWIPSNPAMPDLPITSYDLRDQASKSKGEDGLRAPAFINYELLAERGTLSTDMLKSLATTIEPVQIANSLEHFQNMHPEAMNTTVSISGDFLTGSQGQGKVSRRNSMRMGDDDDIFDLDTPRSIGGMFDDEDTDIAGFGSKRKDDGGVQPSRRALDQGFSLFFKQRDALRSESARENFSQLSALNVDDWSVIFASVLNYTPVTYAQLKRFIDNDILFPFNFLLVRPHARYFTNPSIKLQAGSETVTTYQRRGQFSVGDDTNTGVHVGNYNYYSKVVVKNPKNIFIVRNAFVSGYDGGMGSKFIVHEGYSPRDNKIHGSLFSFLIGTEEDENTIPQVVNVSGKITDQRDWYNLRAESGLHFSSAPFYDTVWGFNVGISVEVDQSRIDYVNESRGVNYNAFQGKTLYRDPKTGRFTIEVIGHGHWGDVATYPGCAAARRGKAPYRPPPTQRVAFV